MTSREDTLIVVTADHSHTFIIQGYPKRGNPILGLAVDSTVRSASRRRQALHDAQLRQRARRRLSCLPKDAPAGPRRVGAPAPDLTDVDTRASISCQQSLLPMPSETHGGEDVRCSPGGRTRTRFTAWSNRT